MSDAQAEHSELTTTRCRDSAGGIAAAESAGPYHGAYMRRIRQLHHAKKGKPLRILRGGLDELRSMKMPQMKRRALSNESAAFPWRLPMMETA